MLLAMHIEQSAKQVWAVPRIMRLDAAEGTGGGGLYAEIAESGHVMTSVHTAGSNTLPASNVYNSIALYVS